MPARRCSMCSANWPTEYIKPVAAYLKTTYPCPVCEGPTALMNDTEPITDSEANHAAFDAYYDRLEKRRADEAEKAFKLLAEQSKEIAGLPEAEAA